MEAPNGIDWLHSQHLVPPQQQMNHLHQQAQAQNPLAMKQQYLQNSQQQLLGHQNNLQQQMMSKPPQQQQAQVMDHQQLEQQFRAAAVSEASSDSGQTAVVDQQDVVWTKLQSLKEKYLQDMNELLKMLVARSQVAPPEQLQKVNHYKEVLTRMIPYLNASRSSLPKEFRLDKLEAFEKQIVGIMETFKNPQQQQQQQLENQLIWPHSY